MEQLLGQHQSAICDTAALVRLFDAVPPHDFHVKNMKNPLVQCKVSSLCRKLNTTNFLPASHVGKNHQHQLHDGGKRKCSMEPEGLQSTPPLQLLLGNQCCKNPMLKCVSEQQQVTESCAYVNHYSIAQ